MIDIDFTNPYEVAKFIHNSKKATPTAIVLGGEIDKIDFCGLRAYKADSFAIAFGEYEEIELVINASQKYISSSEIFADRRNSAIPLLDIKNLDARIEPGAIIREGVYIGKSAIIMMGAVINIGATIGEGTMIDMNAVIGARAIIGKNTHIGAGTVIAGILEPPSKTPVVIDDDVMIGANCVVLEGISIGKGAVVGAGSVVTKNVNAYTVVVGSPAVKVKSRAEVMPEKVEIVKDLR